MTPKFILIFTALCVSVEIVSSATNKIVCYHGTWSVYRSGNGNFAVENIDPSLCTHLIYAFVGINDDGSIRQLDSYLDIDRENIKRFNALKENNPNLKTLVAIGGWNEGSIKYSNVAASSAKRSVFIQSAVNFVQTYGFDGFDLDWEYPSQRGGASIDKENFVILLKEFRTEFDKHGLLLTAAVAASPGSVDLSYDVPSLSKYLDLINVMTYDFHAFWDGVTGQNAPLYASSIDVSGSSRLLNVDAAIRGWIERGADPRKITLGLAAYGRSFTLASSFNNKLGAPVSGAGNSGPYTAEAGRLGYNEIVELQNLGGWTTIWDNEQKNSYMYNGNQWVGFDNPKSIEAKVEFAKSLNLGGVMLWSIETDDFRGVSGIKFQLLKTINRALAGSTSGNVSGDSETGAESDTDAELSENLDDTNLDSNQNSKTNAEEICTKVGYVRDPINCSVFYYCLDYGGAFIPIKQECNPGLVFDEVNIKCDYPSEVAC